MDIDGRDAFESVLDRLESKVSECSRKEQQLAEERNKVYSLETEVKSLKERLEIERIKAPQIDKPDQEIPF